MPSTLDTHSLTGEPNLSPLAGKPAPKEMLVNVASLERDYFERRPDVQDPNQLVIFGTSGHRGSPMHGTFTKRTSWLLPGDLRLPARAGNRRSALHGERHARDLRARTAHRPRSAGGEQRGDDHSARRRCNSDPVISRAILVYNRGRKEHLADGIVITPSHNPPEDGGSKYNPPNGGPAATDVTRWVEDRANELLRTGNVGIRRVPFSRAIQAATTHQQDFVLPYVRDLENVVDMDAIRGAASNLAWTLWVGPRGPTGSRSTPFTGWTSSWSTRQLTRRFRL